MILRDDKCAGGVHVSVQFDLETTTAEDLAPVTEEALRITKAFIGSLRLEAQYRNSYIEDLWSKFLLPEWHLATRKVSALRRRGRR